MNFNSLRYFVFLPCAVALYFLLPRKWRNGLLLILSYYFYMCWEARYALLILTGTILTYVCALLIERRFLRYRKLWLVSSLVLNFSILFFFKYFNFFSSLAGGAFSRLGMDISAPVLNILLPVGISFYTFQALGYTMDVYRSQIPAERNFIDYALFVSFFPQLVAGPIERSRNLLPQFKETRVFSLQGIFDGLLFVLWGLFKKLVIADTLAVAVNYAFGQPAGSMTGVQYAFAAAAFSIQIYCDFSAYSDIARGSARMMGFRLMQNFDAPYLAASIKDFWRRWHISLSTWFKDYLYFPLGGGRRGKARVCANVMIVFLVSGLWHGAALTFVFWGFLHGLYQVASMLTKPLRGRLLERIGLSRENRILNLFRGLFTFALVAVAFVFFRADSLPQAFSIVKRIALIPVSGGWGSVLTGFPLGGARVAAALTAAAVCFIVDYVSRLPKAGGIFSYITGNPAVRYAVYFALIAAVVVFGYYGSGFDPQEFIYFQF